MKCASTLAALVASLSSAPSAVHGATTTDNVRILRSVLRGTEGNEGVFGLVAVTEKGDGSVTIEAEVSGLPDGPHGFHIHKYGDEVGVADGTAAGGHFDPYDNVHSAPNDPIRHVGDLGNIESAAKKGTYRRTFQSTDPYRPTIVSNMTNSIIGRSFVIHADKDDGVSQPTGNAGSRLAVGVIGIGNHGLYNDENQKGDPANDTTAAVEVTEHIDSADFEEPEALVCNIIGDANGYGSAFRLGEGMAKNLTIGARVVAPEKNKVHGYHIHWYGEEYAYNYTTTEDDRDLSRSGGHYNPTNVDHALPPNDPRHHGDAGSIVVNADRIGTQSTSLPSELTTLKHLVGRTCVVHADPDDGEGASGNAGARIAAGQLGYANPETCVDPTKCLLRSEKDGDDSSGPRRSGMLAATAGGTILSVLLMGM